MWLDKQTALQLFAEYPFILDIIIKIKGDRVFIKFLSELKYKSDGQNKLFHSLLDVFWKSGCSSFIDYDDMRLNYKRVAGLVKVEYKNDLKPFTKKCLWGAVQLLPIEQSERNKIVNYLKGQLIKELSWSYATKKNAIKAINQLIDDMNISGVTGSSEGKKYESIIQSIGEFI